MHTDSRRKREKYQTSLLRAAGFDLTPSTSHSETYVLIIEPAFSPTCGIQIALLESVGEISMVLFADELHLFDAVWQEDDDETEFEILRSSESCRRSNALLASNEVEQIRQRLLEADPWTFCDPPEDDLSGRDGFGGLSTFRRGQQSHRFRFATCEAEITPQQHDYISIFCEQAILAFANQDVELSFLSDLNRYW